ncbi:MAG: DUF1963 domain-containing protein [Tateyamaria sp.]|uniref:DUF1963 domain-containing protein n=1 Tax=Tateyamaria sp. TaxID=1929288 RepID=UPI00329F963E
MMFWKKQPERNAEILLKRQVPILFEDEMRSWFGGYPKVPEGTSWPRNSKGVPLQFIAQVACEDFPTALWNGLGPRSGSLLLFANVFDLDRISEKEEVQVVLVETAGPEMEPPEDCPFARHAMLTGPLNSQDIEHPGISKLWRKWPIDLINHEYMDTDDPAEKLYPFQRSAEEIYGAPVSDRWITAKDFGLEQPLTWRGALYVIESILHKVGTPEKFKRDFVGMKLAVIDDPPEPDQTGFNKEFERRRKANPDFKGGDWSAWGAARFALNEKMKAERRSGWLARARPALEAEIALQKQRYAEETQKLDAERELLDEAEIQRREFHLKHRADSAKEMEQNLGYIDDLLATYQGADGEERLSAEFKDLGEAHLMRGNHMIQWLADLKLSLLDRDLDSPLSEEDWGQIKRIWEDTAGLIWQKHSSKLVQKVEHKFDVQRFIEPAIREDLLDLYTGDNVADVQLGRALIAGIETKVRSLGRGARHQIGGQLIPIQSELSQETSRVLLFQISTDLSLGWQWGDMGNLYVTMSKTDLKSERFQNVEAWLEFH